MAIETKSTDVFFNFWTGDLQVFNVTQCKIHMHVLSGAKLAFKPLSTGLTRISVSKYFF